MVIVDELSLYRRGARETMTAQMRHLLAVAALPDVTLQVLPAVAHPATGSEIIIADEWAYAEQAASGFVYTGETVTALARIFDSLRSECYKASESAALLERMAEAWTRRAAEALSQRLEASRTHGAPLARGPLAISEGHHCSARVPASDRRRARGSRWPGRVVSKSGRARGANEALHCSRVLAEQRRNWRKSLRYPVVPESDHFPVFVRVHAHPRLYLLLGDPEDLGRP